MGYTVILGILILKAESEDLGIWGLALAWWPIRDCLVFREANGWATSAFWKYKSSRLVKECDFSCLYFQHPELQVSVEASTTGFEYNCQGTQAVIILNEPFCLIHLLTPLHKFTFYSVLSNKMEMCWSWINVFHFHSASVLANILLASACSVVSLGSCCAPLEMTMGLDYSVYQGNSH